ncbi:hypothetical protein HZY93_03070 [Streptococcus danieliae]|uniref:Uncharacterized protein n=1 Tax=Streptococcus danieliae TaxID=747656 RepID=A0A7Z0RQH8_9STRE|nr:hypothetical protein [Streptococcus danieliae]MBF0717034.1 hypothetical protein [Streptococcus danieliae]NYS48964.1 hypothetical protein [Streptococcus danieliae]
MRPQVAYRIELSELEKRIKKHLRRVDENDSLEFVKKKFNDMTEVMDQLYDLRSRIEQDTTEGFKMSARKRLDLNIRKNLVLSGYLRMNKGDREMAFIDSLIKIDVGLAEQYLFADSIDIGVRAKHSEKEISTEDFNRFDYITEEYFTLFHLLLRLYQKGDVELANLHEVLFVYSSMALGFIKDVVIDIDIEESGYKVIEFSEAKKFIAEKRNQVLGSFSDRLLEMVLKDI